MKPKRPASPALRIKPPWPYALAVAVAAFSYAAPAAHAKCVEDVEGASAKANARGFAELQANSDRAAFILPIGDGRAGSDDVTFDTKPRTNVGDGDSAVTAELLNFPRAGDERFPATVHVQARPGPTNHRITLAVCVTGKDRFTAGTYQGGILIYGPRVNEAIYPLVITSKWPFWVPVMTLIVVLIGYVAVAWSSPGPPGPTQGQTALANVIYTVIAVGAGALTYWSVYVKNATWGEDPAAQIPALVVAAVTAAVAAQQAAKKWGT